MAEEAGIRWRSLLGSRRQSVGCKLTGDGPLPLGGAVWDRSLLRCASAPWPHAHLRDGRGREEVQWKEWEREEGFICDADYHVLAMTIKTLQIHPHINNLALFHNLWRVWTVVNSEEKNYISNSWRTCRQNSLILKALQGIQQEHCSWTCSPYPSKKRVKQLQTGKKISADVTITETFNCEFHSHIDSYYSVCSQTAGVLIFSVFQIICQPRDIFWHMQLFAVPVK